MLLFTVSVVLSHTVFCVLKAKVNHVIPCLSIMWKSSGFFLHQASHFDFVFELNLTTLGKLILLSLKVTLTSFQSISRVSQI